LRGIHDQVTVPPAGGRDEARLAVAEDFDVTRFRQLEIAFPLVGGGLVIDRDVALLLRKPMPGMM
jgi:hypothetical protein